MVEADTERFDELQQLHIPRGNLCINTTVSSDPEDIRFDMVHLYQPW
jgi:hypothetical protein